MTSNDIADALNAIGLLPPPKGKMVRKEIVLSDGSVIWARISRLTPRTPTPRVSAQTTSAQSA